MVTVAMSDYQNEILHKIKLCLNLMTDAVMRCGREEEARTHILYTLDGEMACWRVGMDRYRGARGSATRGN